MPQPCFGLFALVRGCWYAASRWNITTPTTPSVTWMCEVTRIVVDSFLLGAFVRAAARFRLNYCKIAYCGGATVREDHREDLSPLERSAPSGQVGDISMSCAASQIPSEGEDFNSRVQGGLLADGVNSMLACLMTSRRELALAVTIQLQSLEY